MYLIMGKYASRAEEIVDDFDTKAEARKMLTEYRLAYGKGWRLRIKKVKKGGK